MSNQVNEAEQRTLANAVRFLSIDAVQCAKSGHPGMPMGMADIATVLWREFLQHNPANPKWTNRDRFVLSNGHGSMLLYALLHLSGYDVSTDDLKNFRQLHSKTPGHPEYAETPGVETTTGPLGQGLANAVGMAIAEQRMAAEFNRDGLTLIDHHTYVFCGDGCLMEGISHEACSLAGTLKLGKLIVLWDDNGISIDGDTAGWFSEDVATRFKAYGWQVIEAVDGHDAEAIRTAIQAAKDHAMQPTLICCKTTIGYGSPNKAGTSATHGAALGEDETAQTRAALDWPHEPFHMPDAVRQAWCAREAGQQREEAWLSVYSQYQSQYADDAAALQRRLAGDLPSEFDAVAASWLSKCQSTGQSMATRTASQACIETFAACLPELLGGSADLTGSNNTNWPACQTFNADHPGGDYLYYGVREFGMAAIMVGIALYGGLVPFGGTFLVFSDYARNAIRMSALMQQKVIYVLTHDSIALGEDGPTHQPIEHAASLRMIPNVHVWRPCDLVETAAAWQAALQYQGPTCLLLSRQKLAHQSRDEQQCTAIAKGGYVLREEESTLRLVMIATGSEVQLAVEVAEQLNADGVGVRVVAMPCVETFRAQSDGYKAAVLPADVKRVAIEAGVPHTWYEWVNDANHVIGMHTFGASAPYDDLMQLFGFQNEQVLAKLQELL